MHPLGREPAFEKFELEIAIVWLQFAPLAVALIPIDRGAIASATQSPWRIVLALRRVPVIARVL